jgi:hypothetical protein
METAVAQTLQTASEERWLVNQISQLQPKELEYQSIMCSSSAQCFKMHHGLLS